jgi:hypothetical protein
MLAVISDTHLSDGTTGRMIRDDAFKRFRDTLRDLAYDASWREDGMYRPIEEIHLVLLGDILDVIRSTTWLGNGPKPWDRASEADFVGNVEQITRTILKENGTSVSILRDLDGGGSVTIPPSDGAGGVKPVGWEPWNQTRQKVKVHRHYMVGNHDWFYHLKGSEYDRIRRVIVQELGLANDPTLPFPHRPEECPDLLETLAKHGVYARHGDIYDSANFDGDRDTSSLGDAIVVELLVKFAEQVRETLPNEISRDFVENLKEIDNIRPNSMAPVWIASIVGSHAVTPEVAQKVKAIWNDLVKRLFDLDFVRRHFAFRHFGDLFILWLSRHLSLNTLSAVLLSPVVRMFSLGSRPSYRDALRERAAASTPSLSVVYGHTHVYDVIPLDSSGPRAHLRSQVYINSGTWRPYHELARRNSTPHKFLGYDLTTILTFYRGDEHRGQKYQTLYSSVDTMTDGEPR